jgi:hypothetical protein
VPDHTLLSPQSAVIANDSIGDSDTGSGNSIPDKEMEDAIEVDSNKDKSDSEESVGRAHRARHAHAKGKAAAVSVCCDACDT